MGINARMLEKMADAQVELTLWKNLSANSKGWSLKELAVQAKLNSRDTRAFLKYRISPSVLVKVADALETSVDGLLGRGTAYGTAAGGWAPSSSTGTSEQIFSRAILSMPEPQRALFNVQRAVVLPPPANGADTRGLVEEWVERFSPGLLMAVPVDPPIQYCIDQLSALPVADVDAAFRWVWPLLYPLDLVPDMKWLQIAAAVAEDFSAGRFDQGLKNKYIASYVREVSWESTF